MPSFKAKASKSCPYFSSTANWLSRAPIPITRSATSGFFGKTKMNLPISELIGKATRFLFFTGKGGVGKTSLACATAIALADRGKRVLLVSTDPASNLDEVLGITLTSLPSAVASLPNLFALNIDPEEAARAYREK